MKTARSKAALKRVESIEKALRTENRNVRRESKRHFESTFRNRRGCPKIQRRMQYRRAIARVRTLEVKLCRAKSGHAVPEYVTGAYEGACALLALESSAECVWN